MIKKNIEKKFFLNYEHYNIIGIHWKELLTMNKNIIKTLNFIDNY